MQLVQKVKGVNKLVLLLLLTLFSYNKASAQKGDDDFQLNFIKTVHYPEYLKNACTPAFTNLLIDISEKGIVQGLFISDSAPKSLKDEFDSVKNNLDIKLIDNFILEKKLKNCGIIIPIFYVYGQDYCTNSFTDFNSDKYLTFESKTYPKPTFSLKPIIVNFYKPLH